MPEGRKDDTDKLPLYLLPFDALEDVARVLLFGANKYGERNWEQGMKRSRLIGAGLRHIFKWCMGEKVDPETGLSHIAHAACNMLFLLAYEKRGIDP